jgi:hypothetical protein
MIQPQGTVTELQHYGQAVGSKDDGMPFFLKLLHLGQAFPLEVLLAVREKASKEQLIGACRPKTRPAETPTDMKLLSRGQL